MPIAAHRVTDAGNGPLDVGFFSARQVEEITSLSRVTIWRLRRSGTFPQPVNLCGSRVGYPRAAVLDWIAGRMQPATPKAKGGAG